MGPVFELWPLKKFAIFGPIDKSLIYAMKGQQFWCNVIWEFVGDLFTYQKPPFENLCD